MVLTRQQSIAVFEHMREHFLHADDPDNPTRQALENSGISDMLDLLTIPLSLVDRFKYVQAPGPGETARPPQPLNDGRKTLVQLLIKWCMSLIQANAGVMLTEDEWKALDPADFNVYRLGTASSALVAPGSTTPTTLGATSGGNTSTGPIMVKSAASKVTEFKKSIKRDVSSYPALKDQKNWNSWNRAVISLARSHDLVQVFDPTYAPSPSDPEEIELFDQKQSFMYAMFNKIGRAHV